MYSLHITKKNRWTDANPQITQEEFSSFSTPLPEFFYFDKGNISVANPNTETIERMDKIANDLHARIEGDDGEIYADYTETPSVVKNNYRKIRNTNLPEDFPIIDDINYQEKIVTKIEILDLKDKKFENIEIFEEFIKRYVLKLSTLSRIIWKNYNLAWGKDFNVCHLEIVTPTQQMNPLQKNKFLELQQFANKNNVKLINVETSHI